MIARLLIIAAIGTVACSGANRAKARGAVEVTAAAVRVGDEACAEEASAHRDGELAQRCADSYKEARAALLTASMSIDAWDEGKRNEVTCAIVLAAANLSKMVGELRSRDVKLPPIVDDSLRLASELGGCHE